MANRRLGRCFRQPQRHAPAWAVLSQGGQVSARHQPLQPGILGGIDHARVRQADATPAAGFDESLLAMANQQHRIGGHTGLPRIEGLARQDIACGALQIRPRQHQDRAFAPEFQR